jgi:hypothetical protein
MAEDTPNIWPDGEPINTEFPDALYTLTFEERTRVLSFLEQLLAAHETYPYVVVKIEDGEARIIGSDTPLE